MCEIAQYKLQVIKGGIIWYFSNFNIALPQNRVLQG